MKAAQTLEIFQEHEIKYTIESINSNKDCGESGDINEVNPVVKPNCSSDLSLKFSFFSMLYSSIFPIIGVTVMPL
jgi:hypothetical protein